MSEERKVIDEANTNIQTLSHSIEQLNNQVQAQIEKDRRSGASSDSNLISSVEQSSHAFNKTVNQYNEETAKNKEQQQTKIDPDTLKIPQQQYCCRFHQTPYLPSWNEPHPEPLAE